MKRVIGIILACGLLLTACGQEKAEVETVPAEPIETVTEEPEVVEEVLPTLGTKSETGFEVKLINGTGQDIKEIQIKSDGWEEFEPNLLGATEVFAKEEMRVLYYTPKVQENVSLNSDEGNTETDTDVLEEKVMTPEYTIQFKAADDQVYTLHQFPFEDIKEGTIKIDSDSNLAYLEYESVLQKSHVSTLEAEKAIKDAEEQAKLEAEAAAEAEAEAVETETYDYSYESDYSYDYDYDYGDDYWDDGGDEGCLDDGLTF